MYQTYRSLQSVLTKFEMIWEIVITNEVTTLIIRLPVKNNIATCMGEERRVRMLRHMKGKGELGHAQAFPLVKLCFHRSVSVFHERD